MLADQFRFRRRINTLAKKKAAQSTWEQLASDIEASALRREQRCQQLPKPSFDMQLPVSERYDELAKAIDAHQVVIVCGETGSGKTTQLPKICLSLGRGVSGMIGHTQPRRLAARSVANRIAEELNSNLGEHVGFKVRFKDQVRQKSYIKVMTDGILLAETQGDRFLEQYDTIIIDEAHERSLNIDFLLGYLKQILKKRKDLKVIITSATIDPERFSRHFNNAPIIEVSGRTYPVEVRYRPLLADDDDDRDKDMQQAIVSAVDELVRLGQGDILVFLSGERDIRETAETLRKHHPPHTEILPLFARLTANEQNRIFQSHKGRRIVLSTNVAETSLTVPGIKYVIDPGYARISRYSYRSKVQRLPIEKISQASANQRSGRCGRVSAGVCIRLYDEQEYQLRPEFTEPEIQRTNLASVILQMKALGFGDVEQFPFVDAPDGRMIRDGYQTLLELGAVDAKGHLTSIGKQLAKLPVDPRIGRMILAANTEACLQEVLIIASALSIQDPRERPMDAAQKADEKHSRYIDKRSDFLAYLKLWQDYHEQARHLSQNKLRKYCKQNYLSYIRLRDWHDVHSQLREMALQLNMRPNEQEAEYDQIHRALLTGLIANVGVKTEDKDYLGARNSKYLVFPGSALFKKSPKWVVAGEVVETTKRYARTVAGIEPEWIEKVAKPLLKRHYFDPHWEKKRSAVAAYERVTLYGLTVVAKRKVNYGPVDPVISRELFIRGALVEGEFETKQAFFKHNRQLITEVEELEHKSRRQDILADEEVIYAFYDNLLPSEINNGRSFERWYRDLSEEELRAFYLTRENLMRREASEVGENQFPDKLSIQGVPLALTYHFEPGHEADGVTVTVPLPLLNQLDNKRFEWLVPGLLHEKIMALLKSLPKALRRNFVPVPNFADACIEALTPESGQSLIEALTDHLAKITGVTIPSDAWSLEDMPIHLVMRFSVVDKKGREVASGRDLLALQRGQGQRAEESFSRASDDSYEKENITQWDFGELPVHMEMRQHGMTFLAYPALVEEGKAVALRLMDSPGKAQQTMRAGLKRLFMLQQAQQIKYLEKNLPGMQKMCLHYGRVDRCEALKNDIIAAVVNHLFIDDQPEIRDAQMFSQRLEQRRSDLVSTANELCAWLGEALELYHFVSKQLKGKISPFALKAIADIQTQLDHLIYPGFVVNTPYGVLSHYPRYLRAILKRLDKLATGASKDAQLSAQIKTCWENYERLAEKNRLEHRDDPALEQYRWMIEELRVSFFAQELRTPYPVSLQRLEKQWKEVKR